MSPRPSTHPLIAPDVAPGPSAARQAELQKKLSWVEDPAEKEALLNEFMALVDRAKQDPVPEEDAEWARIVRELERGFSKPKP